MGLNVGDKAPEILGVNEKGEEIRLSNYRGKKIVIYFYPKDNTSGCTAQACSLRDNYSELRKAGYEVIGVSVDDENSRYRQKIGRRIRCMGRKKTVWACIHGNLPYYFPY